MKERLRFNLESLFLYFFVVKNECQNKRHKGGGFEIDPKNLKTITDEDAKIWEEYDAERIILGVGDVQASEIAEVDVNLGNGVMMHNMHRGEGDCWFQDIATSLSKSVLPPPAGNDDEDLAG